MRNRLMVTLAAAAAGVALSAGSAQASPPEHDQDPPIRTEWMPCGMEDDVVRNCVWDAKHRGNGKGNSFVAGRSARIWVLPHHIAHYLVVGNNSMGSYNACVTPVSADPTSCIWEESVWLGREGNDWQIPASVGRYLLSR